MNFQRLSRFVLWGLLAAAFPRPALAVFTFTVDPLSVNFGVLQPQQPSGETLVTLRPFSDDPSGWSIFLEASPFAHASLAGVAFPPENFTCRFASDYAGDENIPPAGAPVPQTTTRIYTPAAPEECASGPCSYGLSFQVKPAPAQVAGQYKTTLVFTIATNL